MVTSLLVCALAVGVAADSKASKPEPEKTEAGAENKTGAQEEDATEEDAQEASAPEDHVVRTTHSITLGGEKISYTAEAGTMALTSGGDACEIFYTAYTKNGVKDKGERPITFAFNGGPGSSSFYLHMACLGPRCAELDEVGNAKTLPAKIIDNENSILDMTDLVFIDPVGTGYSRAAEGVDPTAFYGYEADNRTVGDFIRQYVNRNKRWASEKYLAGESYGTTRAVGVCEYLSDQYSIFLNGLMLISSANDYSVLVGCEGNETPYALALPTYAADAWYHKKLSKEYQDMNLEDYLEKVRDFVQKEYVPALFMGNRLTQKEEKDLAKKMSEFIALDEEDILQANLRIDLDTFSPKLLEDQKLMIGRYDGRITGPVTAGDLSNGSADPSSSSTDIALGNTFEAYLTEELNYETDTEFIPLSLDVNSAWTFLPEGELGYPSQESTIHDLMAKNKFLKVWVLCGYYDNATPFYATEWTFSHVFLDKERSKNLSLTYYPSGHMFYVDKEAFAKFRKDAENWFKN